MNKILIIDDEFEMVESLRKILSLREEYDVFSLQDGNEAINHVSKNQYELILCDLNIAGVSGLDVVAQVKKYFPDTVIVIISGYGTIEASVEAMKSGVFDFLEKPFTSSKLFESIDRGLGPRAKRNKDKPEYKILDGEHGKLIYNSSSMENLIKDMEKLAKTNMNVLVTGESGTGKELIARAIHTLSDRNKEPFVPVNCGALPENLFESEIFGHEKGAFTGAVKTKPGLLEFANRGTFFLDEVGELSQSVQVKLLRMLEERKIRHVGGQKEIEIDVRIIAATNKNLDVEVKLGEFRQDLFYRLNTLRVHVPALRERTDDIIPIAKYLLCDLCNSSNNQSRQFSAETEDALKSYSWPGNVRELQNVIGRAFYLCSNDVIQVSDLPIPIISKSHSFSDDILEMPYKVAKDNLLEKFEQEYLTYYLKKHRGNISQAAADCGIDRRSIHRLVVKHNIIYKE
ncbi:MAG: sigma-54 dependent transcriptional regulator [Bacteroidetes bacterium]|nr:sigma-54 dependent transcriptional regulator [Bacteroidota bacterium]